MLEFADDAAAGVAYLRTRTDVDSAAIGILGHSEGGVAASIVASRSKEVSYAILMATPGRPLEELNLDWIRSEYKSLGQNEMSIRLSLKRQCALHELVKSGKTDPETVALAKKIVGKPAGSESDDDTLNEYFSPPYRFLLTHDPTKFLRRIQCPVLVLNGDQDRLVQSKNELPIVEAALKSTGNADVTIKRFSELNHMFQKPLRNMPPAEGNVEDIIDPSVLDTLERWLIEQTSRQE